MANSVPGSPPRVVRFSPDAPLEYEDPFPEEAQKYRREGICWQYCYLDRMRFKQTIDSISQVLTPMLTARIERQQADAATTIQRVWRGYHCRRGFCLKTLNQKQTFVRTCDSGAYSTSSSDDDCGVSYDVWESSGMALFDCVAFCRENQPSQATGMRKRQSRSARRQRTVSEQCSDEPVTGSPTRHGRKDKKSQRKKCKSRVIDSLALDPVW
jgi:hypothetical protein